MNINRTDGGTLELDVTTDELDFLRQVLNECCNGFGVKDFEGAIGANEGALLKMLDQFRPMYKAPIGHEG